ncbi:MAG: D-alanyl-D-alanine carboxypeptidase family protein [Acutalibacteraceae bacterium]
MSGKKRSGGARFLITLVVIIAICVLAIAAKTVLNRRPSDKTTEGPSSSQSPSEMGGDQTDTQPQSENKTTASVTENEKEKYTEKKETVITTAMVNVRKGAGTNSEIVGLLKKGSEAERIATGSNGWSKVIYNGDICYISSKYLKVKGSDETTSAKTEGEKGTTVYATAKVNIRKGPGTDYDIVGQLNEGDKAERLSAGDNGWSRIKYKNGEYYVSSKYLSEKKPEAAETVKRTVVDPRGDNWNLTVVNFYQEYDSSYKPKLKKVCAEYGYNTYMDERAADWYTKMYKAALKDGIKLVPLSGYRSYETQQKNYNNRIKLWQSRGYSYSEAVKKTAQVILPPGTSEHNLGLAMDICRLDYDFDESKEYKWLKKHAEDYGFILRYTEENKSRTGVVSEPWHWRFVGVEDAKAINKSGLCLEDYAKTKA